MANSSLPKFDSFAASEMARQCDRSGGGAKTRAAGGVHRIGFPEGDRSSEKIGIFVGFHRVFHSG